MRICGSIKLESYPVLGAFQYAKNCGCLEAKSTAYQLLTFLPTISAVMKKFGKKTIIL